MSFTFTFVNSKKSLTIKPYLTLQRNISCNNAHTCSEIGLKWFLFAIYDLRAVLGFISVLDFFGHLSLSNPAETRKREF